MARTKTLPPRMCLKHGAYYHVSTSKPRKWTRLSDKLPEALRAWAVIEGSAIPATQTSFAAVSAMYRTQDLLLLSQRTQSDYAKHLDKLEMVFHTMQMADIKPSDVHQYLQLRGKFSKVQANREKAILSVLFNFSRRLGVIDCPNPCEGIKGFSEKPRARYVSDDEFAKVYDVAKWYVQDAMDLALLLGQRPSDIFKIQLQDVQDSHLAIHQSKTGAKVRIARNGELAEVLDRVLARERLSKDPEAQLVVCEGGKAMTAGMFRNAFDAARTQSGVSFQFRDLRAKSATDTNDLSLAQKRSGHRSRTTTEAYIRDRLGELVQPLR